MPSFDDLMAAPPPAEDIGGQVLAEKFKTAFGIDPLPAVKRGSIWYLAGFIGPRYVQLWADERDGVTLWELNGRYLCSSGPLDAPIEVRQQQLKDAIMQLPIPPASRRQDSASSTQG